MRSKFLCMIAAGFLLLTTGCMVASSGQQPDIRIALVAKTDKTYFWQVVHAGAQSAAVEYGIQVDLFPPQVENDAQAQIQLVQEVVRQGYDALLISACDYRELAKTVEEAMDAGLAVVTIDSGVASHKNILYIGSDNQEAGYTTGRMLEQFAGPDAKVGMVTVEDFSANSMQRSQGFVGYINEHPTMELVDMRFAASSRESSYQATKEMLEDYPEINAIAAFNEWTTLGVGQAIDDMGLGDQVTVVAFDNNEESVQMLEKGVIDNLIVQNPFAMGYLGVEQALHILSGKQPEEWFIYTETVAITVDNMFTTPNQKLLFPFSQ